jgi:hypothetical protein
VSRTDKTTPTRVQMAAGDRTYTATHSRECVMDPKMCNLPENPDPHHETSVPPTTFALQEWKGRYWLRRVQCYWSPGPYIGKHNKIKSDCGCSMCTMKRERREMNRRARHKAKAQINKERYL